VFSDLVDAEREALRARHDDSYRRLGEPAGDELNHEVNDEENDIEKEEVATAEHINPPDSS
jgi:hypothetical protein